MFEQMEDFSIRLGKALLSLSEQTVRPAEAGLAFNAFNYLRADRQSFRERSVASLGIELAHALRLFENNHKPEALRDDRDQSPATFDEMENKVLLGNIAQSLEHDVAEELGALNFRIGWLFGRAEIASAENPFRPQVFVQALHQGWSAIDPKIASNKIMLRLLGPECFLPLAAILQKLNTELIERGVLPDLSEAYRQKKSQIRIGMPASSAAAYGARQNKVRDWLLSGMKKKQGASADEAEDLNVPDLFAPGGAGENWSPNTISVKVGPRLFSHLASLQQRLNEMDVAGAANAIPQSAGTLRRVKEQVPPGSLTQIDENTIELLAKIFDFLFLQPDIPGEMKSLIGKLQIPLLKAALMDKKFFIKEDHPARLLIDKLARASVSWELGKGHDDPLYEMIERIVARIQREFDQQTGLFNDAASQLDAFLEVDEKSAATAIAEPIALALREEKIRRAQEAARTEVAQRIDTGEVAGFLEVFLETQWIRILTLAFSVREQKPDVPAKALRAMDDLIWSVKPKTSAEERKHLINRLPAILSMTNAWLNAIKWNEPERAVFFSRLAERHAALVRIHTELSPRHQVEAAVNVAQRASERRMKKQQRGQQVSRDEFACRLDDLKIGEWLCFARNNGSSVQCRLAWISPQRSRFIFTSRQGRDPVTFTSEELAQSLRDGRAGLLALESMVDRALAAALDDAG
ncbi:MAG: hypothetical protein JWQ23_4528 [Herminiimonas sp.]|nr:hypothetical protein [Herminiimonas sp.]